MTATQPGMATRPDPETMEAIERLLACDGGRPDLVQVLRHQFLLDAVDRRDLGRLAVWPPEEPRGVLLSASGGTVMPAGDPQAAAALADAAQDIGWRVLVGPAAISEAVLEALGRGWFRRRPRSREQRFMWCADRAPMAAPAGLRPARETDLDALTDLACQLHVEDEMGPPIPEAGRASVRSRLRQSVRREQTWVVERGGEAVAKVDLALQSARRGAQIAGVYVRPAWRGRGLATGAVAALTTRLLDAGLPGVTLHVRADNVPARAAYARAGYEDAGLWTLAIR